MLTLSPEIIIMTKFDADGVWTGPAERKILFNGEVIDIDVWAQENGITLPDAGE